MSGLGVLDDDVAFDEIADVVIDEAELIVRQRAHRVRQRIEHAAAQPHGLEHLPQHEQRERRQRTPQRHVAAVVAGQRVKAARPGGDRSRDGALPAEVVAEQS